MNSKDYAKLVASIKEQFATMPGFSKQVANWLEEKDRLLVGEMSRASGGLDIHAMEFHAGKANMRQEFRQTFLPKEIQDE